MFAFSYCKLEKNQFCYFPHWDTLENNKTFKSNYFCCNLAPINTKFQILHTDYIHKYIHTFVSGANNYDMLDVESEYEALRAEHKHMVHYNAWQSLQTVFTFSVL